MSEAALALDDRLALVDLVWAAWRDSGGSLQRRHAVEQCIARLGYAAEDVQSQLDHVADRCSGDAILRSLEIECGGVDAVASAPEHILHLVAGTVPGLAVESIVLSLAIGAKTSVRASASECVLGHFLQLLADAAPTLAAMVQEVGDPQWDEYDAAVVYGTDATVELVRAKLPAGARIAGYGSRQGVLVVAEDAARSWASGVADDILTFRQRGCMSPSLGFVLGDAVRLAEVREELEDALEDALEDHVEPLATAGDDEPNLATRAADDAAALATIASELSSDPRTRIVVGPATLDLRAVTDRSQLTSPIQALGSLRQTCVLAAGASTDDLTTVLHDAGMPRVCAPGDAHFPPVSWPHDGIGRLAPLLSVAP